MLQNLRCNFQRRLVLFHSSYWQTTRARIQMNLFSTINLLFSLFRPAQCGTQEEKKKEKESKRKDKALNQEKALQS